MATNRKIIGNKFLKVVASDNAHLAVGEMIDAFMSETYFYVHGAKIGNRQPTFKVSRKTGRVTTMVEGMRGMQHMPNIKFITWDEAL